MPSIVKLYAKLALSVPSIVKLYAKLAQKHNVNIQQLSAECPEYLQCVSQLVEHSDPSIRCKL